LFRSSIFPSLLILSSAVLLTGCESVRSLKYENQALQQRIFQYKQDYTALENEYQSLQKQYQDLDLQKQKLDSEVSVLRQQVDSLNNLMSTTQKEQADKLLEGVQNRVERENELKLELDLVEAKLESTTNDKLIAEAKIEELEAQINNIEEEKEKLADNLQQLGENSEILVKERDDARSERDDFRRQIKALESSSSEAAQQVTDLSEQLRDKEKEMTTLAQSVEQLQTELETTKAQKTARSERKVEVTDTLRSSLSSMINSNMVSVTDDDEIKILIQSDNLYQPGTVLLSTQGKEIVDAVGDTLAKIPDVSLIMIEGHTDSVPVKNMPFIDNWDLAAARAATVTRTLSARSDIPSKKLRAISHAFFSPLNTNDTEEGRRSNRRVEVTLIFE